MHIWSGGFKVPVVFTATQFAACIGATHEGALACSLLLLLNEYSASFAEEKKISNVLQKRFERVQSANPLERDLKKTTLYLKLC